MAAPYYPQYWVREFHEKFAPDQKYAATEMKLERRSLLINEEHAEVAEALIHWEDTLYGQTSSTEEECKAELAKELADLLYVIYGTADELGINLPEVFRVVHESNMSKVWEDGTVRYNEYGKVLKPPTYTPPNLDGVINGRSG